jgi:hypothetical protein
MKDFPFGYILKICRFELILFGSSTLKLASAWLEVGATLRRDGFSESRRKVASTVWRYCAGILTRALPKAPALFS